VSKKIKIGILTGGGDCAGLNSAVKWVTKTALDRQSETERSFQYEVIGIKDGWKGLSFTNTKELETIRCPSRKCCPDLGPARGRTSGLHVLIPITIRTIPPKPRWPISSTSASMCWLPSWDDTLSVAAKLHNDGVPSLEFRKRLIKTFSAPITRWVLKPRLRSSPIMSINYVLPQVPQPVFVIEPWAAAPVGWRSKPENFRCLYHLIPNMISICSG